jgi:hypothetical protein
VSLTKDISQSTVDQIFSYASSVELTKYNLNTNNCTTFGYYAAMRAGIVIKDASGSWPFGGAGFNPASIGQSLIEGKYYNAGSGDKNGLVKDVNWNMIPFNQ